MKKKFLSLVLVLAMALTLLPTAAFAAETHDAEGACKDAMGTEVPVKAATCTEAGVKTKYYTCSVCGNAFEEQALTTAISDLTSYIEEAKGHTIASDPTTAEVPATCCADGTKALYACTGSCGKTFIDAAGKTEATNENKVIAANGSHTFANDAKFTSDNKGNHSATCTVGNKTATEACDTKGTDGACSKCGYKAGGTGDQKTEITAFTPVITPGPATAGGAVTIGFMSTTPANLADVLEVTNAVWTNTSTSAEDNTGTTTKAPTTPGTYNIVVTAAVKAASASSYTLKQTTATVTGLKVNAASTTTPTTPTTPETPKDENKAPSTNSQGIPVASEVSTSKQADQAIGTLKNSNANTLQENLLKSDSALSSFQSLESAVQVAKNVRVEVEVDRAGAPSAVRGGVAVSGAAFNASSSNTTVKLVVNAPSQAYSVSSGYQVSMTLTGVSNPAKLDVPVVLTLPLPSDVRSDRVVVLHYHGGSSSPDVIVPVVNGNYIRFTVTGFSDFVVTDEGAAPQRGTSSGFVTVNSKKNDSGLDSATLAAIAGMLTGDGVFADVPKEHWAAKEIRWARDGGLMSGYGTGAFGPNGATTRQQLWMVLARLDGLRPADMSVARTWAMNAGVSDGTNPNGALSRQQLVTMLYRFAKTKGVDVSASAKLGSYADGAKVASYAKDAMSWAVGKGIVTGSGSKLNPEGTATRAHFAVFLYRYSNG